MILSLAGICLENLPAGLLRRTSINGTRARSLIEDAAATDRLIGVFEFGPVPKPEPKKHFGQLFDALRHVHGIDLDPNVFRSTVAEDPDGPSDGPLYYANPLQIFQADADQPILVVSYAFTPGPEDAYFDMDIASDQLTFDLIEVLRETDR